MSTVIPADLARHPGETLMSRSQGKRLLSRCESFREITIDFKGIDAIGPAFADEVFRVFAAQNPTVIVRHQNANADILAMIERASRNGGSLT